MGRSSGGFDRPGHGRFVGWFRPSVVEPRQEDRPTGLPPKPGTITEKPERVPRELLRRQGTIHHLTVTTVLSGDEIEFWGALGWRREHQKHRGVAYKGEWLRSRFGDPWLWLVPGKPGNFGIGLVGWMDERLADVNRLAASVYAQEQEPFWGARRVTVWSPAGIDVELLERAPNANRYGPPS